MGPAAITASHLGKSYVAGQSAREVLADFNISFQSGEITALMGPSGVGKTTLLRLLSGLEQADKGEIAVSAQARPIRYAFQNEVLLPWRTVTGNLRLSGDLSGKHVKTSAIESVLERTGLQDFSDAFPSQLSGGMRRRVTLARTALSDFQTILLDEPLSGIDLPLRIKLLVWLRELISSRRATCIVVMHDLEDAIQFADRVVVLVGRPAKVGLDLTIPLPRPTSAKSAWALRPSPEFVALAERLASQMAGGDDR